MTQKVNGFVASPDQFLSGAMKMFTVSTATDIKTLSANPAPAGATASATYPAHTHNEKLDLLIEAISTRAQPVILGTPAGSGPYTLRFAVEHAEIFGVLDNTSQTKNDVVLAIRAALADSTATLTAFDF